MQCQKVPSRRSRFFHVRSCIPSRSGRRAEQVLEPKLAKAEERVANTTAADEAATAEAEALESAEAETTEGLKAAKEQVTPHPPCALRNTAIGEVGNGANFTANTGSE